MSYYGRSSRDSRSRRDGYSADPYGSSYRYSSSYRDEPAYDYDEDPVTGRSSRASRPSYTRRSPSPSPPPAYRSTTSTPPPEYRSRASSTAGYGHQQAASGGYSEADYLPPAPYQYAGTEEADGTVVDEAAPRSSRHRPEADAYSSRDRGGEPSSRYRSEPARDRDAYGSYGSRAGEAYSSSSSSRDRVDPYGSRSRDAYDEVEGRRGMGYAATTYDANTGRPTGYREATYIPGERPGDASYEGRFYREHGPGRSSSGSYSMNTSARGVGASFSYSGSFSRNSSSSTRRARREEDGYY